MRIIGPCGIFFFQIQITLGFQIIEIPEVDIVSYLIPFIYHPFIKLPGPACLFFCGLIFDKCCRCSENEFIVLEFMHLLLQRVVLQYVILKASFIRVYVRTPCIFKNRPHGVAMLKNNHIIVFR